MHGIFLPCLSLGKVGDYPWSTKKDTLKVEIIAITKRIALRLTFKRTLSRTWRWNVVFLS